MTCDLGVSVLYDSDTVLRERLMFPQYCLGSTSAATTTNDSASGMLEKRLGENDTALYFKSCSWNYRRQRIQNLALYMYIYCVGDA